ncbi:MAG: DUF1127 domain-containing protein [Pseudomonadota bacterium]
MTVITTNAAPRAATSLNGWLAAIRASFDAWVAYRRTVSALSALSDRELADIGISRSEIRSVARNGR